MFRFKQFTIRQERTAMKVCTDACLLGAYADVSDHDVSDHDVSGTRLLDVGTGTGLLALMAAQRNPAAQVDAIEMDEAAFGQAIENVAVSPFASRIRVWHGRIQEFAPPEEGVSSADSGTPFREMGGYLYDRILTNPPFYTNHLHSPDDAVNRALHNDELPFEELIEAVVRLLKRDGQFWVLLPPFEMERLAKIAQPAGLYPFRQLSVRHQAQKPVFRSIRGFSLARRPVETDEICIYEPDGKTYSDRFRTLLTPFYLIF